MEQLLRFLTGHAETVLFVGVFAEQIGVPLPAIPMLLAAGAWVADGTLQPVTAVVLTVVAAVLADVIWFYAGRRSGSRLLQFCARLALCDDATFARAERLFARHGMSAVVGAKFLPWLGFFVPPLAGVFGIKPGKFLRFDALGSVLYGVFYLGLGFLFDREIGLVLEFFKSVGAGFAGVIATLTIALFVGFYWPRRKALRPDETPSPAV